MNVGEVKKFSIANEIEDLINDELSDAVLKANRNAEVTHNIYGLTTDEIEITVNFVDVETDEQRFLIIISSANAFTFLEESGIPFPETL